MDERYWNPIQSTQLDEHWHPIFPQDVPIGGIMRSPCQPPGYYITFRRVVDQDGIRFEHLTPGKIELLKPPGAL